MRRKAFRGLRKKVRKIEKNWGNLENFAICSTFGDEKHKLKMKGETFKELEAVYGDLEDLEKADLFDYKIFGEENGNFSKKRRDLFC